MREHDIRPADLLDEFFRLLKHDAERLATHREAFVSIPCPFCAADRANLEFTKDGYDYRSCIDCGSLFVSPRPTEAALADYAHHSEAVRFWSTHFYRQTADARREKMFRPRAALAGSLLGDRGGRVADIGAGYGLFLQELRALGVKDLVGIEPDKRLASICRDEGFAVIERWVEEIESGTIEAELATCFEVIEHAFDPLRFLEGCRRAVRQGGRLLLTTLTIGGFDLQVLWAGSRSITPPQHINFPSLDGMRRLATRAGLVVDELSTPGELDVDIVRNVLLADPAADVQRFARTVALADEATRVDLQAFLRRNRLSSHLRCVLRRE